MAPYPDDLADLNARQSALLDHALAALAPGGMLVYSTCSLEPEENEGVISACRQRLSKTCTGFRGATPGTAFSPV